ncbi:MAG TPA: YIEGIA family protein [Syntrophomonadaceae bacterium]|nr:YIEGIA family protein [Syntrophomonadaceae bacterium]HRX21012.1 YIEGIA family protein [Syntrophomonadaceae bacterium]
MQEYLIVLLTATTAGFLNRIILLRRDYRQYPTYPHGQLTHLALGFIAASLGAVAVVAIAKPDFVAVTFLVLAAQEFREIRNMERETLGKLEENKLITRGTDYIEGIARVFEARNYMVIFTALVTGAVVQILSWPYAFIAGPLAILTSLQFMSGKVIGDIAEIQAAKLSFSGSMLKVEDVFIMNVGMPKVREKILREGMGVLIKPKDDNARITLDSPGQRQAIIHDAVAILGTKVDINEPDLMPIVRKQIDQGYLALYIVASEPDLDFLIEIIKRVPVIESSQGAALKAYYGRKAAD